MTTVPSFPGMNPYLESPYRWPEIHTWLIVEIARSSNPQLLPKYRAAVETRVYIESISVGIPDASVYAASDSGSKPSTALALTTKPEQVTVPMPLERRERYLEIREVATQRVLSVIEALSPSNKRSDDGRQKYLAKRQTVLSSATHLIEIDLLRTGEPMPMAGGQQTDYQVLVSRADKRPLAERYGFNLRGPLPTFSLPLEKGTDEPIIHLHQSLTNVCRETGIVIGFDYTAQPQPPLPSADFAWVQSL